MSPLQFVHSSTVIDTPDYDTFLITYNLRQHLSLTDKVNLNYFLAKYIMLWPLRQIQLVRLSSLNLVTQDPSAKYLMPMSVTRIQSAKLRMVKFFIVDKHFRLPSLIFSQSVIDTCRNSVHVLAMYLRVVSVRFEFEFSLIVFKFLAEVRYRNESSVKCGESWIANSVNLLKCLPVSYLINWFKINMLRKFE